MKFLVATMSLNGITINIICLLYMQGQVSTNPDNTQHVHVNICV